MGGADENDDFSFITLRAATLNVIRLLKLDEQEGKNSHDQPQPGDRAADSVSDRRATGNEKMIVHGDASLELERSRRKR